MLQADDVVNQSRHGGSRGLGIAMRQRHGDFFMTALDQFWHGIAAIIHDRVVETAKTGAWITCRIDDTTGLEHIDDDIRAVLGPPLGPRRGGVRNITGCRHAGSPLGMVVNFCYCACCVYVLQVRRETLRERGILDTR
jgi:hypothetical protein